MSEPDTTEQGGGETLHPRMSCGVGGWSSLAPAPEADEATEDARRRLTEELERRLVAVLESERLVVLAGFGTSFRVVS